MGNRESSIVHGMDYSVYSGERLLLSDMIAYFCMSHNVVHTNEIAVGNLGEGRMLEPVVCCYPKPIPSDINSHRIVSKNDR